MSIRVLPIKHYKMLSLQLLEIFMCVQMQMELKCILCCLLCRHQDFHFSLPDDAARVLSPSAQEPLNSINVPKFNIAVYARNISGEMAAHLTLRLNEISTTVRH